MKVAVIMFFAIAILGAFALINMSAPSPSAFVVQPSEQVLGYCPVSMAGEEAYIGGRMGTCECETLDKYYPLYWQRDNCQVVRPSYARGTWAPS